MHSLALLPPSLLALVSLAWAQSAPLHTTLPSGLRIDYTTPARCSRPSQNGDSISVHYRGTLEDGTLFDESYKRGQPFTFTLGAGQVIRGWDLGLLDMCPGERRNLTIPSDLAYGNQDVGGVIKAGSTLLFATELVDIVGVTEEFVTLGDPTPTADVLTAITGGASVTTGEDGILTIATAPADPPEGDNVHEVTDDKLSATPLEPQDSPDGPPEEPPQAECHLLGPFALLIQGLLGAFALLSLVFKRYRENPKRPWRIWFFDVSKQVFGSMLTHVLNLAMSMLSSVDMVNAAKKAGVTSAINDPEGRMPNPCSFYLLNLAIDTTLGIPVLYLLLKVLHALFLHTAVAKPPESIQSGHYGPPGGPPKWSWYLKQLMIYFIGLVFMKLFVFFLFAAIPQLPWIGDWALRWTKGNEVLEVTFAMFVFPLAMNAVQYWVIDNFIMDKKQSGQKAGYEEVHAEDDDAGGDRSGAVRSEDVDDEDADEHAALVGKSQAEAAPIEEINPIALDVGRGGSRRPSPSKDD
ncbi:hypothetical protein BAUCODRAFT_148638 [Baudoinia panamericana UAMH 10762]|uniref:peptidylprolyl isomerase n=1 Tax=Baudoinia panamericana (strain UAMH 10762) TaxID=717646 RepID=M2MGK3_BAUPA|nr:uncharacterized protein BAUCODRAFT_148638 [Baudoinia panamericana UAMH 10762]EMC95761.1 hypothetical protein BAUCODRAFT_148638 [Baudoinia panamericana UAMH 10762]